MADNNITIEELWSEYNDEVIEKAKGMAEDKVLDYAFDFITKHCPEKITGMNDKTMKIIYDYIKNGTLTNGGIKKLGANAEYKTMKPHMRSLLLHVRF